VRNRGHHFADGDTIRTLAPDAVILDIRLSRGTGIEVLESVRRPATRAPVVIMLTNSPTPQHRTRCLAAGADYFLDESADFGRLGEILRGLTVGLTVPRRAESD